jgi:hypothetical protein
LIKLILNYRSVVLCHDERRCIDTGNEGRKSQITGIKQWLSGFEAGRVLTPGLEG